MSEEQFSASLEGRVADAPLARPRFEVDPSASEEVGKQSPHYGRKIRAAAETPEVRFPAVEESADETPLIPQPADDIQCPTALSVAETAPAPEPEPVPEPEPARESEPENDWRNQVAAKVNRYKSRRPQKDRYPSLQLQFEPAATYPKSTSSPSFSNVEPNFGEPVPIESVKLQHQIPASVEATARVIEFPRSAALPVTRDELADPVMDRPRIVEAPELLPPPPALGGILMEPVHQPEPERRPGFDIPLQPAPFSRRLLAGGIDAFVVTISLIAFGYIFFRITGAHPQPHTAFEVAAALLGVFWPAYQYAFLVFSAATPGLRVARLQVTRFDGTAASRNLRRWRVLASLLSSVSLGLGYAWCFLDEDQLSWHDRITRTHLAPQSRAQVAPPNPLDVVDF